MTRRRLYTGTSPGDRYQIGRADPSISRPVSRGDGGCGHVLAQDVIWVAGGSVADLLALWRLHGVGPAMHAAWEAGRAWC